ncbi:hypothetical protein K4K53_007217 [Colletotrichum sp. SAR 10_77]|nr:hypothetical protein K4K52_011567 [Colletotrichum sp. SAR 10_76]KAI8256338.1 hypothetical protein K4K53_007217 [Colletotrichum sp. SAR 10_77]
MDSDSPIASSGGGPFSEYPGPVPQQHPSHLPGVRSRPTVSTDVSDLTPRPSPRSGILRRNCPRPPPINIPSVEDDIEDDEKTEVPPTSPESPGLPTPLLAGYPGREISGAKSDGREWAYDWDSPPVLLYPDDLSKTEFHEHPLARHIELEKGWEQGRLALYGLILPAKIDNGTPTYTWESDDEEEEDRTKAVVLAKTPRRASRPPPLRTPAPPPAINTERQRTPSKVLQKVKTFANFVANADMEKEVPELPTLKELLDQFGMPPGTPAESAPRTFLRPTKSSNSLRPKTPTKLPSATKLRNKRSATGITKIQISEPVAPEEMKRVGQEFSEASTRSHRPRTKTASESDRISNYAASLRSPSNLISPSISSNMPLYLLQPAHPTVFNGTNEPPPKFRLARPRLAPMEYARQYLLAKAKAEEQGEECTVQKPDTTWCWSEHYKEFLIIPSIPKGVTRNFLPDVEETDPEWIKKKKPVAATKDMDEEAAKRRSFQPLPLNLAPSSPLLPAHLRTSSLASTTSSDPKSDSSLDAFTLDLPRAASSDHCLLQSTKALITNPTASIPRANTDVFVAVNTSSEPIHRPAAGRRPTPLDFMPQSESAVEQEEDLTPQQLREPSSAEAQAQPGTLENSTTILRPVSYVPNTEVAQTYTASEASQEYQNDRRSQASTLTVDSSYTHRMPSQDGRASRTYESRMEADLRRLRAEERQNMGRASLTNTDGRQYDDTQRAKPRGTRASHAGNSQDAASIASVASSSTSQRDRYSTFSDAASASTSESRRSQALSFTSVASSDRSIASKPRRSRIDTPQDAAAPFRDPRLPALDPVIESPSQSPGLRISATSPAINSTGRPRKSSLPSRRDSAQQGTDSELPSLKVRRRRPVADLDPLPASQAYPQPLRFSSLKSPPPGAVPGQPSTNITRSSSRLITDIGKELDREMKDMLSPRTADLVAQEAKEESLEESNVETPTRRPPRQVRSMRSLQRFDAPSMPAPSKPLPSIPQPKKRSDAPSRPQTSGPAFVDVDFGPGPVVSRAHPPLPPIPPPRVASVPRPPIPTVTPLVSPTIHPSPSTGSVSVTHNDFSVKKDRTIRPAASVAAFGYRSTPTVDPMPARQVRRLESTANLQPPPVPPAPPVPTSARTRILGKMASMAELKHRREVASSASGGSSEEAVGMRTFLGEDVAPAAAPSKTENSKKKFFGGLFRRKKDVEK